MISFTTKPSTHTINNLLPSLTHHNPLTPPISNNMHIQFHPTPQPSNNTCNSTIHHIHLTPHTTQLALQQPLRNPFSHLHNPSPSNNWRPPPPLYAAWSNPLEAGDGVKIAAPVEPSLRFVAAVNLREGTRRELDEHICYRSTAAQIRKCKDILFISGCGVLTKVNVVYIYYNIIITIFLWTVIRTLFRHTVSLWLYNRNIWCPCEQFIDTKNNYASVTQILYICMYNMYICIIFQKPIYIYIYIVDMWTLFSMNLFSRYINKEVQLILFIFALYFLAEDQNIEYKISIKLWPPFILEYMNKRYII